MMRVAVVGLLLLTVRTSALSEPLDLNPNPDLTPQQVVEFQLDALRHNDEPTTDAGIERSFRFASPSNRLVTGPLSHFSENCAQPGLLGSAKIAGQRSTRSHSTSGPGKGLCNCDQRQRITIEFSVHAFSPRRGGLSRLLDDRLGDEIPV